MTTGARLAALGTNALTRFEPLIRFVRPDLGRTLAARREAAAHLVDWGLQTGGGIWLHGASAGELLGAAPAMDALLAKRDLRLCVTHFSRSGAAAAEHLAADFLGFAPLDRPEDCEAAVAAVAPDLLVFAKLDLWPNLVAAAGSMGVPVVLINATVREGSRRMRPIARRLFRRTYASLAVVGAASEDDAERLLELGVRQEVLHVTGDAAFDLASRRARDARVAGGLREHFEARLPARPIGGLRLIAGSTGAQDEKALLDALGHLPASTEGRFGWQLVIAPHRTDEATIRRVVGACRARREPVERWSRLKERTDLPAHGCIVFDEMGKLAELYTAGDVAYVGGGLSGAGLHNVLEPAAAGLPVLFGGRHDRGDAVRLIAAGGGMQVTTDDLGAALAGFRDASRREAVGDLARRYVETGSRSAERTLALLAPLLGT